MSSGEQKSKVRVEPLKSRDTAKGLGKLDQSEEAPAVRANRRGGKLNQHMKTLADTYRQKNPSRDVRFVYAPQHRSELSNVTSRKLQGYSPVLAEELGSVDGFRPNEEVRVGDTVMMSIERKLLEEERAERRERADEQSRQVEKDFYDQLSAVDARPGQVARMRPAGRAVIEERDEQYDIRQREDD